MLPSVGDSSLARVSIDRELGRTLFRHSLGWHLDADGWQLRVLDSSLFRWAGEPAVLGGEAYLHAGWSQDGDSPWGAAWRMWNRTDGLGARDASLSENAWRQTLMLRRIVGDSTFTGAFSIGALLEHADPGRTSLAIRSGDDASKGVFAAGAWSVEASWSGLRETPAQIECSWSDLSGSSVLRQARTSLGGSLVASLLGDGKDSVYLEASHDSVRNRSVHLISDRADVARRVGAGWTIPVGKQKWTAAGGWTGTVFRDFSDRNPELAKGAYDWRLGVAGALPWGLAHSQVFVRNDEGRVWKTAATGDRLADELSAAQDRRDRDQTGDMTLSDTLAWRTERFGGVGVALGLVQSLRSIRHPSNESPAPADRPDEDVSRKQFSVGIKSDIFLWGDKPTLNWATIEQEDVYLRAVHSFQTWSRDENRLAANLSFPVGTLVRPDLALWAREQRDAWRFQPEKRKGRLEYGATVGGEIGPVDKPWVSIQWTRWTVKSGSVVGESFAPDQIQDVWNPECRGFIRWSDGWRVEPWSSMYLERVDSWGGEGWSLVGRSRTVRAGGDLSKESDQGIFTVTCAQVWNHPGENGWIGSFSARYAW